MNSTPFIEPEPFSMLDLAELPETYGVDEVGLLFQNPSWFFVYWELTESGKQQAERQLNKMGKPILRIFSKPPFSQHSKDENSIVIKDIPLPSEYGKMYIEASRPGSTIRISLGLISEEGYFIGISSSGWLKLPLGHPIFKQGITLKTICSKSSSKKTIHFNYHLFHPFSLEIPFFPASLGNGSGGIS